MSKFYAVTNEAGDIVVLQLPGRSAKILAIAPTMRDAAELLAKTKNMDGDETIKQVAVRVNE